MSQQRLKQSIAASVVVYLKDSSNNPVTAVAFGSVTCYLTKNGGTPAAKTITALNWTQLDATNMPGWYAIGLSTTDTNTVGFLGFCVRVSGAKNVDDIAEISAFTTDDLASTLARSIGMLHENSYMDNIVTDSSNNLIAYRLRLYDSKANSITHTSTGLVASYAMTATFIGTNLKTYLVTRES